MKKLINMWVGIILSACALYFAFQQVEMAQVLSAFAQVDYRGVVLATGVQLATLWAVAIRWKWFLPAKPKTRTLLRILLVAQLANMVLPVRLGVLIRSYLGGREMMISKVVVLGTLIAEKVFDSLIFVLMLVLVMPFVAPNRLQWSALPVSTLLFLLLFPILILITWRQKQMQRLSWAILSYIPWLRQLPVKEKVNKIWEVLYILKNLRYTMMLWGGTLIITLLGALVNAIVLTSFDISVPWIASFFLLVVLQMGARIPAPLGGIGIFQYLCIQSLAFFDVDANMALSFGVMLHFVVYVPGALLGAIGLYQMHESLSRISSEAKELT